MWCIHYSGRILSTRTARYLTRSEWHPSLKMELLWLLALSWQLILLHLPGKIYPPPENVRPWNNAGLMLGQRRRRWPSINPTLVQGIVFAAKKHWFNVVIILGQRCRRWPSIKPKLVAVSCLLERYIVSILIHCWASIANVGPTLSQQCFVVLCLLRCTPSQQTRYIETIIFCCWPNVFDAGPTSRQHCFNVLCLLG